MVQHEGWVLWRREEVLERGSEAEMPATVHAQDSVRPCRPIIHDCLEIGDICRGQESVDNGFVIVVAADEIVQTSIEAARVVVEAWSGELVD